MFGKKAASDENPRMRTAKTSVVGPPDVSQPPIVWPRMMSPQGPTVPMSITTRLSPSQMVMEVRDCMARP